jgi:hypothetical protein
MLQRDDNPPTTMAATTTAAPPTTAASNCSWGGNGELWDGIDEDDGTDNARDGISGGEDGMNEGTTGTRTRGQQQRGQGDSNGNDDDPSTRPCRCKRLFAGGKRVLMDDNGGMPCSTSTSNSILFCHC